MKHARNDRNSVLRYCEMLEDFIGNRVCHELYMLSIDENVKEARDINVALISEAVQRMQKKYGEATINDFVLNRVPKIFND